MTIEVCTICHIIHHYAVFSVLFENTSGQHRTRTADIIQWMQNKWTKKKKKNDEVKRLSEDKDTWRKMTHYF